MLGVVGLALSWLSNDIVVPDSNIDDVDGGRTDGEL
jgi:hypothetical protein